MAFTLTFTFVVSPLVILLGLIIALTVNALNERLRGLVIFFSLLPFVVTPADRVAGAVLDDRQPGHIGQFHTVSGR